MPNIDNLWHSHNKHQIKVKPYYSIKLINNNKYHLIINNNYNSISNIFKSNLNLIILYTVLNKHRHFIEMVLISNH
jgi:hypothetical protein